MGYFIKKTIGVLLVNEKSTSELNKLVENRKYTDTYYIKKIYFDFISTGSFNFFHKLLTGLVKEIHLFFHLATIWKNRNCTLNFKLKAYNMLGTHLQAKNYSSFTVHEKLRMHFFKRIIIKMFGNLLGITFLNKLILLLFRVKRLFQPNLLRGLDCLLVMHGGRISFAQDYLIWFARSKSIATIAIQENWDNLSSKSFLYQHPDFFATWGEQSSLHLKQIHNYQGVTYEVGSRRLNIFFHYRNLLLQQNKVSNLSIKSTDHTKKILLIGSGDGLHDFNIARECIYLIDQNKQFFNSEYVIVYRPHPYGLNLEKNIQKFKTLSGVTVDIPSKNEDDTYRAELILNSQVVISLYSTMILESCILNKPCLIPSFIENSWNFKTSQFLDTAEHYLGMSNLEGLFNPDSYEEFVNIVKLIDTNKLLPLNDAKLINWFCSEVNTSDALYDLIDRSFTNN
jgi:hypothetical protein